MAWHHKPKSKQPIVPPQCGRCGKRPGQIHLERVGAAERPAETLWLCADCARALRNDARES
jgi:protein-arginine kinase activator protein McsA